MGRNRDQGLSCAERVQSAMAEADERVSIGDLIRQYRLDARLTQAALAERAGISVRAIQDLERSVGRPQRETARRLADALALTAERRVQFDRAATPAPRFHSTARSQSDRTGAIPRQPESGSGKPRELGGEQKCVTILIADVAGLTESVHGFEPDVADRLQSSIVPMLVAVIHGCLGTVNRVGGDGIMAIFGAPVAHEDDAIQACNAALALHEAFDVFARQLGEERALGLGLRVGIASSDVILRSSSSDAYGAYAALGPAVRVATRLVHVAPGGTTLLTGETVRAAEGYIRVRSFGSVAASVPVVGSSAGTEAFELLGRQPPQTRFQRVVTTRQLTPFIGRDAELAALAEALAAAMDSHGQILALVGEPGVGKSRLFWEATSSARTGGWLVLQSGAVSHAATPSYGPAVDLLNSRCGIEAHDDGTAVREKLTDCILGLDSALAPDLPALLALLDANLHDAEWEGLDPPRRRARTLAALKRLVLRQSQEAPLVLVFEDLHWIDGETLAFLDALVESLPAARLLLLVSYRPEYEHHWGRKSYYTQVRVDVLPAQQADDLLGVLLGDDTALRTLRQHLIAKTEGNPLFLEESVRRLVDTGALVGDRGAYRQARPIDTLRVPDTVQTVISARIDRLEPEAKRVLQLAAVIGKDVPFSLLQAIVDVPDELDASLSRLLATEFIYEAQLFPELVYTFKHALTHEVAYGSLLRERRQTLHARIVDAIERTNDGGSSAERVAEQIDSLAQHAVRGQLWDKAVTYLRRAGQRDAARSANRQAATYFEQALDALNHLPNHRDAWELGIDIRLELRNVLLPLAEFRSMFDHLQTAEALAIALDDRARLGWVSAYLAAYYSNAFNPRQAEAAALRALAIADERAELPLQVMAHFFLGLSYVSASRYRESREPLRWNVDRLRGDLIYQRFGEPGLPSIFSRSYMMRALAETGDFEEALARGDEAVRLAELTDFPLALANALEGLGYVHLRRGNLRPAVVLLERGLQICQQWQIHLSQYVVEAYLGFAYALIGRDAQAVELLAKSAATDSGFHPALRVTMLGEAHLLGGRSDRAQQCVEQALAMADLGEEHGSRAWTLRLAAEVVLARGPESAERAAEQYRAALALATDQGMRPLQAHCHFGLGKLYRRIGRADDARIELSAAIILLDDLEMAFWLPEAKAELADAQHW
jgi:class 3 adenylate cyclase/tetratricopeptide (TPR) repeat protein